METSAAPISVSQPPAIVLIHGGQVGAWSWDGVRSQLTTCSVAMDLPGHGSHTASLEGLRINDCVDAVLAAIPLEGRIVLAGHSLGGAIALAVASQIPGRLAHLVLLAAMVPNSGAPVVSSLPPVMRFLNEALSKRAAALVQRAYGGARGQ